MERTDKIVATALQISRKDALALIKKGRISANGKIIKDAKTKLDENSAELFFDDKRIYYNKYVYIMMNKPKGVISASNSKDEKTVIDILPDDMKRKNLFPAGKLAHSILSPKNHIPKTYIAKLDKPFDENIIKEFEKGIEFKDEKCLPAKLETVGGDFKIAKVVIKQGMYHQVKRMFSHFKITVLELKRIKMGALCLDENLKEGECKYLAKEDISLLSQNQ